MLAAAVLVGGEVLLLFAVTPATRLIDDEALRRAVTRVVARRFARMTLVALAVLVATGLYQFFAIVPEPIRANINDYRWGPVFTVKMILFVMVVLLIGLHGMYYGPRIAQASELADAGHEDAASRLADLRRTSLLVSLVMLIVTLAVLAIGVTLGYHEYSYLAAG